MKSALSQALRNIQVAVLSETPPPTQIVSICGTVISIGKTERSLNSFQPADRRRARAVSV
jgi:hypothetical protein